MAGIIWAIIVVLFILWLLGFTIGHLGSIIHLVLVIAVVLLIFNIVTGRGARV
ncbi:MAG TPA: lmo0937 family membrane protein [Candidatus Elarobacter sp.]